MTKSKIALKPYLEKIEGYCGTLSKEEVTEILISLARDVPTAGRVDFLEKIESYLPDQRPVMTHAIDSVQEILNGIEALKESIEERIESIEDGSYWDDPDLWREDGYYDEEPDDLSEDQDEELGSFFGDAESLFLSDRLEDARRVYGALFNVIDAIKESYYPDRDEIDIKEARARYCRSVYETSSKNKKFDAFIEAMQVDVSGLYDEKKYDPDYPLMQDVIDARPGEMEDLESFLPSWKKALMKKGIKGRPAVLLLEVVNRLEGISGVAQLARKWKEMQPQGYLFWLDLLKKEKDQNSLIRVSKEGLKALKEGGFREHVAEYMIEAAGDLHDAEHLLLGKRERFCSHMSDQNLLDLLDEATRQKRWDKEVDTIITLFKEHKSSHDKKELYVKALLMSGNLKEAVARAKKERSVGWSYGSVAGVAFGSVLSVLAGHSEKAGTIKSLLKGYANKRSVYSGRFTIDDGMGTSFYDEIIKGLKKKKEARSQATESLSWAEKIGNGRIDHIVSNKHRRAYGRAAQVLGSLAEVYLATGKKSQAVKLFHTYYNEKYKRFNAFRREVKTVVTGSDLLRGSSVLK